MTAAIELKVNGENHHLDVDPDAPLLQILRNDLGLKAAKFGCGLEQCGACKILVDGQAVPSCATPKPGKGAPTAASTATPTRPMPSPVAALSNTSCPTPRCTPRRSGG